jgi:quinol monooxygenase YgiN
MSETVSWLLVLAVEPGELERFEELMAEMVAHTRSEPGTLAYEWFVSGDGSTVHLCERYIDSAAAMAHLVGFGKHFAQRFTAATQQVVMYVYGNADETLRRAVAAPTTEFLGPFGGFAR